MKVLISAYAFNPSGSLNLHPGEDIVGWKLVEQIARFHEVTVITHTFNRKDVEDWRGRGKLANVRVEYTALPFGLRAFFYRTEIGQRIYYYLWQKAAWSRAKKLHHKGSFDLAHHITFNNDWIPSVIGARIDVPFVWGPIGGGQRTPASFMKLYPKLSRMADAVRLCGQWSGRRLLPTRRKNVKRARAILVCNEETKMKMPAVYRNKVVYFPVNGMAEKDVAAEPSGRSSGPSLTVLCVGRLIHWKNFKTAVDVFSDFRKKVPEAELKIIGSGPEEEKLRERVEELGLTDRVSFVSWLPREELLEHMRQADVFLHPALREGGGAVIVEAMACGLPVICLDNAGPGFHIQNRWGIKIEPRSPEYVRTAMTDALLDLHRNPERRRLIGEAALERVRKVYLWDRQGERMEDLYRRIMDGRSLDSWGKQDFYY
ncbi:MAG: glycosyltransferase family 4 protein [Acidobacteria bacterium]|nr:glycosyltransferase family 4 protein [Acidobacteriota bacterium]